MEIHIIIIKEKIIIIANIILIMSFSHNKFKSLSTPLVRE